MGVGTARTGLGNAWTEYKSALVSAEATRKKADDLRVALEEAERAQWDASARLCAATDALSELAREEAGLA